MALKNLTSLKTLLHSTGLQQKDPRLFQLLDQLIGGLSDTEGVATTVITSSGVKNARYLTSADDSALLPNSRQLLAGVGIAFDDSIFGERTISQSGYWTLLTDGNVDETDFIFANGDPISVFVPI